MANVCVVIYQPWAISRKNKQNSEIKTFPIKNLCHFVQIVPTILRLFLWASKIIVPTSAEHFEPKNITKEKFLKAIIVAENDSLFCYVTPTVKLVVHWEQAEIEALQSLWTLVSFSRPSLESYLIYFIRTAVTNLAYLLSGSTQLILPFIVAMQLASYRDAYIW